MKVKYKLLIILLLPLIGMIYFSLNILSQKIEIYNEMSQIEDLTKLSVNISLLVHETQKERGRTAGYLGANGKSFVEELNKQRNNTDEYINKLKDFIYEFDINQFDSSFNRLLESAFQKLDRISKYRELIDSLNIATNDAISYYTQMNAIFLDIIGYSAKMSNNSYISTEISSYDQKLWMR